MRQWMTAAALALGLVTWLLLRAPGQLGPLEGLLAASEHGTFDGPGIFSGWASMATPFLYAWSDGRPLLELMVPAILCTLTRVVPALIVVVVTARALALSETPGARATRRLLQGLSLLPLFLLGYLAILSLNRAVAWMIERGLPPPAWFALPLGDGGSHPVRWGLEVMVMALGDGAIGSTVGQLRQQVQTLRGRPFVIAATLNDGDGAKVVRRHLRPPIARQALVLLPQLLGAAVVVEVLFQEPGAGRLLVERLIERDLPVVGALVLAGLLPATVLHRVAMSLEAT